MLLNLWRVRPVPDGRKAKLKDKWAFCVTTSLNRNPSFIYDDLNIHFTGPMRGFWGRPHPEDKTRSIDTVFEAEKESLRDIGHPFDGYIEHYVRVRPTCLVTLTQTSIQCRAVILPTVYS